MTDKVLSIFLITVFALWFSSCASKTETASEPATETVPAADLIGQAETAFQQREQIGKLREAVGLLKRARQAEPRNFDAAWKLAQFNYFLGKHSTDEKESDKAFEDGKKAGKIAANIAPDKPDGYFWEAANYGGGAERSPLTRGLPAIEKIRELMGKVVELQPDYQGAMAYNALATVELKASVIGGKPEKALEYLKKGLEINPQNGYLKLTLAETYLALDRDPEAKKELESILNTKPPAEFAVEYQEIREKSEKLLRNKF